MHPFKIAILGIIAFAILCFITQPTVTSSDFSTYYDWYDAFGTANYTPYIRNYDGGTDAITGGNFQLSQKSTEHGVWLLDHELQLNSMYNINVTSGLLYKVTREGTGASPTANDTVKVQYRGTQIDGTEFDSSYKRGEPATFPLSGVIKCWTEGLQLIKVGGKATLYCPADLAYGYRVTGTIPAGSSLIFEVERLEIMK